MMRLRSSQVNKHTSVLDDVESPTTKGRPKAHDTVRNALEDGSNTIFWHHHYRFQLQSGISF